MSANFAAEVSNAHDAKDIRPRYRQAPTAVHTRASEPGRFIGSGAGENFLYGFKPPCRAVARAELARGRSAAAPLWLGRADAVGHARNQQDGTTMHKARTAGHFR